MPPGEEEGIAKVQALLEHHMTGAARDREERAARDERIFVRIGSVEQSQKLIQDELLELRSRQERGEEKADRAIEIARRAMDSNADLEGTMMREIGGLAGAVSTLQADSKTQNAVLANQDRVLAKQNEDLSQIKAGTSALVEEQKYRSEERKRWKDRLAAFYAILKFVIAVSAVGALAWGAFKAAVALTHH